MPETEARYYELTNGVVAAFILGTSAGSHHYLLVLTLMVYLVYPPKWVLTAHVLAALFTVAYLGLVLAFASRRVSRSLDALGGSADIIGEAAQRIDGVIKMSATLASRRRVSASAGAKASQSRSGSRSSTAARSPSRASSTTEPR